MVRGRYSQARVSRCLVARGVRFVSVVSGGLGHGQDVGTRHGECAVKRVCHYCVNGQVGGKYVGERAGKHGY